MLKSSPNFNNLNGRPVRTASKGRCRHTTPAGRRCRLQTDGSSGFCTKHHQEHVAEIASTLTRDLEDLTSADEISTFLSRLLLLLAQDKISARRAAVLTYIASQLLRSVNVRIAEEKHGPGTQIIMDLPGPETPEEPVTPKPESVPA